MSICSVASFSFSQLSVVRCLTIPLSKRDLGQGLSPNGCVILRLHNQCSPSQNQRWPQCGRWPDQATCCSTLRC
ncbi:hypothetical protein GGR58DRAFT_480627 [Xylaria digitata]|nr:hypothetical protein GGR58DRAFT_480627 [Xylaria digitata]